jgi:cysteine synthase
LRLARLDEFAGKTIVAILPDSGERYISTVLFEGIG